jgi:hypothetical protein
MQDLIRCSCSASVTKRGLTVAFVVGSILALINHGDKILLGTLQPGDTVKILITFLVPYCVSVFSSVMAMREDRRV